MQFCAFRGCNVVTNLYIKQALEIAKATLFILGWFSPNMLNESLKAEKSKFTAQLIVNNNNNNNKNFI